MARLDPRDVLAHADGLYNFARWLLATESSEAEDLVQETYARAFAAGNRFEPGTNLRAWLFRILRNLYLDRRRRQGGETAADPDEADALPAGPGDELGQEQVRRLVADDVAATVRSLSEPFRAVVLFDMEGFTEAECASILGCAEGTVKSRLHRARAELPDTPGGVPAMTLSHDAARALNVAAARGRLAVTDTPALQEHLAGCEACRTHADSERRLTEVLETKLPQYAAPLALKRQLAMQWAPAAPSAAQPRRAGRWVAGMVALAASVAAVVGGSTALLVERRASLTQLEGETVNDHLRVLGGAPLAQVTGGLHEVKPWFGGKLDFAPNVRFAGDDEFPLSGGAVEPFLDRRAAVFVYKRRLHTASLFVVPAEGLAFSPGVTSSTVRGFNVVLWRANDQGYALVSDLLLPELLLLQQRIASTE